MTKEYKQNNTNGKRKTSRDIKMLPSIGKPPQQGIRLMALFLFEEEVKGLKDDKQSRSVSKIK